MTTPKDSELIIGLHPVRKALETGKRRCFKVVSEQGARQTRLQQVLDLARRKGVSIETLPRESFLKRYGQSGHQYLAGYFAPRKTQDLGGLIETAKEQSPQPVLVLHSEIQDPQNLGAALRSAEVLGVQGAVIPNRRSAPLNETVAKCASGALETLPVVSVNNLVRAAEELKREGYWIVGIDPEGASDCNEFPFEFPLALVLGGEEKGIRPLLKKMCDATVRIPMRGQVESLNASAAAAILFYEVCGRRG